VSVAALVPVKALDAGKSRLVASLTRGQIERLSLAMLDDVVGCLLGVDAIDQVAVVTPDARVGERARELGALALVRDDPGLNPSLDGACSELAAAGADTLLVLLGDVAAARAEDIDALFVSLQGLGGEGVVLAPSRDGGTSALLRAPWDAIPNRFGKHSAAAHREAALAAGLAYAELPSDSLASDLDRVEDAEALARATGSPGGTRTRALLHEFGFGDDR
jgi:2-phospho-L-lactate guanylyltransferase